MITTAPTPRPVLGAVHERLGRFTSCPGLTPPPGAAGQEA